MNTALDIGLVSGMICAALVGAFFSLAPRPWRAGVLKRLGAIASRAPPLAWLGRRLIAASARYSAAAGCGGCGDCGANKPPAPAKSGAEVKVPLSSIKRR